MKKHLLDGKDVSLVAHFKKKNEEKFKYVDYQ
jgi:hypothetical protein